ncbi:MULTISPECIES: hypothetical protein [Nonlabens]|uniref:Uncharacterized protein n=1 Tax=Nonlabens agnitus TaxID=870484 RepID=A0A2S9WTN8_9FLAO|nr:MULTISPECIES: hypothetical protein [Nonlabens]KQC33920.1 hypothetical protein AAU57_11705 [Nonlabens sp. YIK11]PRP66829.1 hypothetical protein BST86_06785 [Nonlabens agnitus]
MSESNPFQSLVIVSQDTCFKPVCLCDTAGLQLWAFFEWSDKFSLSEVVFCQLNGDKQVGEANFTKDGKFHIKLVKGAKPLKKFNLSKKLVKDHEYPTTIDLNEKDGLEEPIINGRVIIRDKP